MDAQIFQGQLEADRSMRSVQKAKAQMEWFSEQVEQLNLVHLPEDLMLWLLNLAFFQVSKLKGQASKGAFKQFIALNAELITIKHYQVLNQTAMTKILKKHDKRSGLT